MATDRPTLFGGEGKHTHIWPTDRHRPRGDAMFVVTRCSGMTREEFGGPRLPTGQTVADGSDGGVGWLGWLVSLAGVVIKECELTAESGGCARDGRGERARVYYTPVVVG